MLVSRLALGSDTSEGQAFASEALVLASLDLSLRGAYSEDPVSEVSLSPSNTDSVNGSA